MSIREMVDEVRRVVSRCDASEKDTMEALVDEFAEVWKMRLEELEDQE